MLHDEDKRMANLEFKKCMRNLEYAAYTKKQHSFVKALPDGETLHEVFTRCGIHGNRKVSSLIVNMLSAHRGLEPRELGAGIIEVRATVVCKSNE